jgi:hypothetical protein
MSFANTVQLLSSLRQQSGSTRRLSIPMGSLLHPRSLHFAFLPLKFRAAATPFCAPSKLRFPAKRLIYEIGDSEPNPSTINTSKKSHFNSSIMNTYTNTRLKVVQNEHLQKKGGHPLSIFTELLLEPNAPKATARPWSKSLRCADAVS